MPPLCSGEARFAIAPGSALVCAAMLALLALLAAVVAPTPGMPVVVAGAGVPRDELQARAVAFDEHQSFSGLVAARPYVTRLVIDERWAVREALTLRVPVSEAAIDAALDRARREWAPRPWADLLVLIRR